MKKISNIVIKVLGLAFIALGLLGVFYGPYEIYCFYLFSEGGPFNYPGFGVGSLWFLYLFVQNLGYYAVAAICLPLGIGFLKRRRWAFTLTKFYGWVWLGVGGYLLIVLLSLLPSFKISDPALGLGIGQVVILLSVLLVVLILLPVLLLRFVDKSKFSSSFNDDEPEKTWIEKTPMPLLGLYLLNILLMLGLHILALLQCVLPVFGTVIIGRPAIKGIAAVFTIMVVLFYGLIKKHILAWWGSVVFSALCLVSSIISFWNWRLADIFDMMQLPLYEVEFLQSAPLLGSLSPLVIFSFPLLLMLILTIRVRKYFYNKTKKA